MKTIILSVAVFAFLLFNAAAQQSDYSQLKTSAEREYSQRSYQRAHEIYAQADKSKLSPSELRWVEFRLADTLWRADVATQNTDNTKIEEARKQLKELIRATEKDVDRDLVWAEAQESLGDSFWMRRDMNWAIAWPYYEQALDWWAGQRDLERARARYLAIIVRASSAPNATDYYVYTYYGNHIPLNVLENALKISNTANDRSYLNYLIAMTMRQTGHDIGTRQRIPDYFDEALTAGKQSAWYDDALFHYAQWMHDVGPMREIQGQWQPRPDYIKALELFRRITREFAKGETRYFDQATQQISAITTPSLRVGVSNIFLPDSELQFHLIARNVRRVNFALYAIDLTRDIPGGDALDKDEGSGELGNWITRVSTRGKQPVKTWSRTIDTADYKPLSDQTRVDGKLAMGAYLLEATGDSVAKARDVLLVSDATLVVKSSGKQALAFFSSAVTSAPIANASLTLWEHSYENGWRWRRMQATTNAEGLAQFSLRDIAGSRNLFVAAGASDRQAFATGHSYRQHDSQDWRIYAFTDRPAYRPKEKMQWKIIARQTRSGAYWTPADRVIQYEIHDPRNTKVAEGKATLNSFGSAWGSLELGEQFPLGQYQIHFWDDNKAHHIGNAALFRLEEYKLPEFKVEVKTPEQNGKKKAFRIGERVEVDIQADYYFGGPVSNASVEVVVYQNPFYHYWFPRRDYPWYYDDLERGRYQYYGRGQGQVIKRETIRTDATGKATLTFDTPRENYNQDFEFRIEARVVDASRREIIASDTVRVTRQRYYVYPRPEQNLYRPQDKVAVDIKAIDANEQPVQTEGTVKVTRDYWVEVWIDPRGREVQGEELRRLQRTGSFPQQPAQGRQWQLKFRGYHHEDILTTTVRTDAEGVGRLNFTPAREGYYRVAWQSSQGVDAVRDRFLPPITSETYVFVATNATTELGYRRGGVEIIVDKDTFRVGQTAPVMISVPTSDRYVLFSVEAEDLFSYRLIHVTGTAKLIEVPIEAKHVPNIFLSAFMTADAAAFMHTKQVIVPPVEQFLAVNVRPDRAQYQPREEGTLIVDAKDANGRPVSAEIALGLIDESVKYIQQDYAGDPRQFYYGRKRAHTVFTTSTLNQKRYTRFTEVEGQLRDENDAVAKSKDEFAVFGAGRRRDQVTFSGGVSSVSGEFMATDRLSVSELPVSRRTANLFTLTPGAAAASQEGLVAAQQEPAVQVRSDFRSTILWLPDVKTDAGGTATVKVKYPDSLTTWSATARAVTTGNQFGMGDSSTRTKQPLIVRLQAPRFFVVGDQVTVSAVINNNTDQPMRVSPALNAEGVTLQQTSGSQPAVEVKANSEKRVDWQVVVTHASEAKLKVEARGAQYADAMEKTFTIFEHGIEKFVSRSGKMRGDTVAIKLDIPKERRAHSTELTVQVAPTMATTMLDALPYLIEYPYGCTEQTMSRFLPAAITAKTLRDLGLKPERAMNRVFGGIEPTSAAATHTNAPRDLRQLEGVTKASLERLYDFQHQDGGWGWWKEGDSDHFMTAYVVWGMTLARQAGINVKSESVERAVAYLDKELVEEERNYDGQAWMLHALAVHHAALKQSEVGKFQATAFTNLWTNREKLNAYTRALLALAAHSYGYGAQAKTLVENLENGVKFDSRPDTSIVQLGTQSDPSVMGTAHWGEDGLYWRWSDGGVEATSFALRALLAIDPKHKLIEPVTNWLVKNRRGAQWSNTRDTAIAVLTLNDYLRTSGELQPAVGYQVLVNGSAVATRQVTADDALSAPTRFSVPRELIRDGQNEVTIVRKNGTGPLYFSAEAEFFSLEEPLKPVGNEIFVRRQYFKLVNHPTLLKGIVSERVALNDGETVKSGERVEVVLTVEAKNNYEYLLFEDLKPAGLEAVQVRSGQSLYIRELKSGALNDKNAALMNFASKDDFTGRSRWVYQELRDRKVAMFIDRLPQGVWQLSYELRAEAPGAFHGLPVLGHAMYVPEIRTNGSETRIRVVD